MYKLRPLSETLQKNAIEELNEDPRRIESDIQTLRTWIEQQPHLRARTDEQFLLAFLRGCKYSLEKAKAKIDKFYMFKSKFPELFTLRDFDDPKMAEIMKLGVCLPLPTPLNEDGCRIILLRQGAYDPSKYSFFDVMRVAQAMNEILMWEDDHAMVNGFIYLMDFSGWSKEHFFRATLSSMHKMTVYAEEAMPLRPKAQYVINAPSIFESIFNMIKPFIPEKQLNRIVIIGSNLEKIHEKIPQKYLPHEYGGQNSCISDIIVHWETKLRSYREYFLEDCNYGTDENIRPGKPIDFESLFGMDGSFRKINVD